MITRGKLTKKYLMKLNNDEYIVSNVFIREGVPVYAGRVSTLHQREMQWRAIVESSSAQRLCNVFKSKEDAGKWLSQVF